jgi:hypothetical protein
MPKTTNDLAAAREIFSKTQNEDGSFGKGGNLPDETGVEGVTDNEVRAAAAVARDAGVAGEVTPTFTEEQLNDLQARIDAGEQLSEEEASALEAAAGQGAEGGEDVVLSATELAEAIGWDPQDLYDGVLVPLDDGQEPMPLGELKNQYQDQRRTITEMEQKIEAAEQGGQQNSEMAQLSQGMMQLSSYMQQLNQIEQQTNWQELEEMDPAEATLKRQKLWQARQETGVKMQQLHQHEQGLRRQKNNEQRAKMVSLIPAWRDDAVRKSDQEALRGYLKTNYGFNDTELNRIQDARTMAVLQNYMATVKELNELKAQASLATKRVRQAPRVLRDKGGRFMSGEGVDVEQKQISQLAAKAKQTGNKYDAREAVKALLERSQRGQKRSTSGRPLRRRPAE